MKFSKAKVKEFAFDHKKCDRILSEKNEKLLKRRILQH
jgi:hypothetical protein